jgi:hypothetical protein
MLQCSWVTGAGDRCVSVYSTTKSAKAWDLIAVCRMYVMSSLESPHGNPSRGEVVPYNFPEPL